MAHVFADRVKEVATTAGAGAFTLGGAIVGFRAFSAVCANLDTVCYVITNREVLSEWEVGLGTWGTGNLLTRTTVYASSNAGAAVSFSAGVKDVFLTYPAVMAGTTSSGGALGSLLMRDTGASAGASWLQDVAAGSVLVSGGVGAAPVWSATPSLASLALLGVAALTTAAESWVGPSSTAGVYFKGDYVGIGTTPLSKLHVKSPGDLALFEYSGMTAGRVAPINYAYGALVIGSGDGTKSMGLAIGGTFRALGDASNRLASGVLSFHSFEQDLGLAQTVGASIGGAGDDTDPVHTGMHLDFKTGTSAAALAQRMRITSAGKVGIGTTEPLAKLAINGGLHVGGDADPGDDNAIIDGTLTLGSALVSFGANDSAGAGYRLVRVPNV